MREFGRLISSLALGKYLTREQSCEAYRQVILNEQPELQQGAFLLDHIARGPTIEELGGAWEALDLYDTAKVHTSRTGTVCDIVGTGSDQLKTVNCSSPAALIAAACGLTVAKKGARLVTGVSGASDIFEILGLDLDGPLSRAQECLDKYGICYLPGEAFLKSGWARLIQSMRFTSAFNIIGPITRPCEQTNCIVIGAYAPNVCDQLVAVLKEIGMEGALAPYGMVFNHNPAEGMDEFSPSGPTRVVELKKGDVSTYEVTPEDFGIKPVDFQEVASLNNAEANAQAILEVLRGRYDTPLADFFCMNSAAALYIAGYADSYADAMVTSKESLANGKAFEKLEQLKEIQGA
ncbi:MAG: anthranilate phosphoribosyltransferase [Desulfomonile tiedjei]|uniref:Anthranilate phosphoribosyltransferase n=1 Tax=Desulfomonile tiedjei TaxID=2358 RepID=A0A9D6V2Z9_9BACT|nr:anthranilate phosphoribosyltransferase [Desulfomonile tiedjei]